AGEWDDRRPNRPVGLSGGRRTALAGHRAGQPGGDLPGPDRAVGPSDVGGPAGGALRMPRLIRAEFRKLFTTRLWLWLLLGSIGLTVLYASLAIAFGDNPGNPTPPLSSPPGQRTVFSVGQGAGTLVAVLAAIGLIGEFRHRTVTPTFLATPRRGL